MQCLLERSPHTAALQVHACMPKHIANEATTPRSNRQVAGGVPTVAHADEATTPRSHRQVSGGVPTVAHADEATAQVACSNRGATVVHANAPVASHLHACHQAKVPQLEVSALVANSQKGPARHCCHRRHRHWGPIKHAAAVQCD
eukprot:283994-Chlamydomonas_euryale.AAC.1